MKILFLTSRLPYPPYRGDKLKIFNLIKILSRRNEVHLLSFIQSKNEVKFIEPLKEYCKLIKVVYLPPHQSIAKCLLNIATNIPFQVSYFISSKMKSELDRLINRENYDIIHTHLIRMAQYSYDLEMNKVLDLTDAVSLYFERMGRITKNPLKKVFCYIEYKRLRSYEIILNKFNCCFVCADRDREFLHKINPRVKIYIIPNGVDLDYFSFHYNESLKENFIIYTGNMSYWPNIDGILYFCSLIFPLVKQKVPNIRLFIVGQNPPKEVRKLSSDAQIIVTGKVEDIRPYYTRSLISVCPIRFKGGTLNKILEPLSIGLPVVSTRLGAEGLDILDGRDILMADEPHDFAEKIIYLLDNPDRRKVLAINGRTVVEKYGWVGIVSNLEQCYDKILC